MRRYAKYLTVCVMVLAVLLSVNTMKVSAEEVKTGTLGDNNKVQYTYEESTKTLTLTGSDSGLGETDYRKNSPIYAICPDVETIVMKEFKPVGNLTSFFKGLISLKKIKTEKVDTSNVTDMSYMFEDCNSLSSLDLSGFDTSNVTNMISMFCGCSSLSDLDVGGFDTSNVTIMSYMFEDCNSLSSLDLSSFDTSNVTNMYSMFYGCISLGSVDVGGFDTSDVTNMTNMFCGCNSLSSLDLSSFDTSKATMMRGMFAGCNSLSSLDLSSFDTSKVMYMSSMFANCSSLSSVDLSSFDTSKVMYMDGMFGGCSSLSSLVLGNFDTSNVMDMSSMFSGCSSLSSLDVSSFDISNVKYKGNIFWSCYELTTLHTPKVIPEGMTIDLPHRFCDAQGNTMKQITTEHCNKVLTKQIGPFIATQPADANLEEGKTAEFKVKAEGSNLTYQWQFKSAGSDYWSKSSMAGSNTNSLTVKATAARNGYQYRCVVKDEKGNKAITNAAKLTVNKAIEITNQPAAVTAAEGAKVTFQVGAKGAGLTYQWQFKSAGSNFWADSSMTGSKTNSLTVEATAARNGYQYRCVVKDEKGNKATTNAAKLTVNKSIEITGQPASVTAAEGAKVTFKVEAKGTGLTYQWQFKSASSNFWADSSMTGSKTNSITVEATAARNGYQYRCVVKDANGGKITTGAAKLTVTKTIEITSQPAAATVAEGANATFKVEAKGTGLTYRWQFKSAGSDFWSDSSMAGSRTGSITVKGTTARNGYQYRCVVKDANGSKVITNAAKLTVQ